MKRPAPATVPSARGSRRWRRDPVLWVFVIALVVRLAAVVAASGWDQPPSDKTLRYDAIAASLLDGEGFALGGGPTAGTEPLYPLLLAALYGLFGASATLIRVVLALLDAIQCGLWVMIAHDCLGERSGWMTGGLMALCPYFVYLVVAAGSDTLFLTLLAVFVLLLVRTLRSSSTAGWAVAGAVLGAATLCRAASLALPVFLVPFVLAARWPDVARAARGAALLLVAFLATLTPWTIRNAVVFHRFIPVQSLGGYHLLMATGGGWKREPDAAARRQGAALSPDADAASYRAALRRILQDPGRFAGQMARRLVRMWYLTHSGRGAVALGLANALLLALAAAGAVLSRQRWRSLIPLYAVIGYFVALHSVFFAIFRYLMPTVPALIALASVAILAILGRRPVALEAGP